MVYSWNNTITDFFLEKGITVKWYPENNNTSKYLFFTNIKYTDATGQDTFFKSMNFLTKELYKPFTEDFKHCSHIKLMYHTHDKGSTYLYFKPDVIC